jgi:hypothetical protein
MGTLKFHREVQFLFIYVGHKACGRVINKLFVLAMLLWQQRELCGRGLSALKISVIMWKNDATVWTKIILLCLKTIHSRSFLTQNHVLWNLFEKEPCDKQDTNELHMHKKMCKMVTKIIKNIKKERNWKCILPSTSVVRIYSNDVSYKLENLGLAPVLNKNQPEMYKNLNHLLYCYRLVLM